MLSKTQFIVRVTPDAGGLRTPSIQFEVELLEYLESTPHPSGPLPLCPPLRSRLTHAAVVREDPITVVAFPFAQGEPVVYPEWKWLVEKERVVGLGRWMGRFHLASQRLARERPEFASRARRYDELHEGVLAGVEISEEDQRMEGDPLLFGVAHGDVNPSNYHWVPELGLPCMFDWDQAQRSWFGYDLAQPIWGVVSLEKSGNPLDPNHGKVPEADSRRYTEWLLEGYEGETKTKVDRDHLHRMVLLRRQLYLRFCTRAVTELEPDSFMGKFCQFVVDSLTKDEEKEEGKKQE